MLNLTDLEKPEDVGYHDGNDAEWGADDAGDRLVGYVDRWFAAFAFVLGHILKQLNPFKILM